jgi:hypothetical protein
VWKRDLVWFDGQIAKLTLGKASVPALTSNPPKRA